MQDRRYTCIVCPRGCILACRVSGGKLMSVSGNLCPRGAQWVRSEIDSPKRNIATSVRVEGGTMEIASVRLSAPVDKALIFPIMERARRIVLRAPLSIGDIAEKDILSSGADLIVTRNIPAADGREGDSQGS